MLEKINLSFILFLSFIIKIMVYGVSFPEALVTLVLASVYAFNSYNNVRKPHKPSDKMKDDLIKVAADVKEIKGALSKVSLGQARKPKSW